jgi:hypothetical protein
MPGELKIKNVKLKMGRGRAKGAKKAKEFFCHRDTETQRHRDTETQRAQRAQRIKTFLTTKYTNHTKTKIQ